MKARKFCRNNSNLQLLWELRERQLEGILGPIKGSSRDAAGIRGDKMKTTSANTDCEDIIKPTATNNNTTNIIDNNNASHEDTTTNSKNVDQQELTLLGRAVDCRRSYELDKIRRHKMEAAEDIERFKKEKLQKRQAKEEEKKRDLEMLTNYYPWGRSLGNFEKEKYATQPQEYQSMSPTLRWPVHLKHMNNDEGAHREILQSEKDKLVFREPNEPSAANILLNSMKDRNPGQENSQNVAEDHKIVDSTSSGHKRKYVPSDVNPKYAGLISPRMKRTPSPSEVMRARAARVYMEELKKGMEEQRKKKEEMEKQDKAPIGELATVMGKGRVGRPRRDPLTGILLDNHLKISDVSKEKIGKLIEENPIQKAKYGCDLIHAAEERYRLKELEKLRSKQQEIQHQETYNELWGRPGGGAPRGAKLGNRYANLNNVLYKDLLALGDITGKSSIEDQRISPSVRYSTHQNQYDYPKQPAHLKEFKEYNFRTPWANFY